MQLNPLITPAAKRMIAEVNQCWKVGLLLKITTDEGLEA